MAIITCRECGKDVSSAAAACPHCGAPVRQPRRVKRGLILAGATLALAAAAGAAYTAYGSDKAQLRRLVVERLNDPGSAQFRNERIVRDEGDGLYLCGEINARNRFGAMVGYKKFLASRGGYVGIEDTSDPEEYFVFAGLYDSACTAPHLKDHAEFLLCRHIVEEAARRYAGQAPIYDRCDDLEAKFRTKYGVSPPR